MIAGKILPIKFSVSSFDPCPGKGPGTRFPGPLRAGGFETRPYEIPDLHWLRVAQRRNDKLLGFDGSRWTDLGAKTAAITLGGIYDRAIIFDYNGRATQGIYTQPTVSARFRIYGIKGCLLTLAPPFPLGQDSAQTTADHHRGTIETDGLLDDLDGLFQVKAINNFDKFYTASTGHIFDADTALRSTGSARMGLETRHGGSGVVQDHHRDFGLIEDCINHGSNTRMEEGRIPQMTYYRNIHSSGYAIGNTESRTHAEGCIVSIERGINTQTIAADITG